MKIGVFGLWHLGCTITASWSELDKDVIGFDYDTKIVENLKNGTPPLYEPHLEHIIKNGIKNKNIQFTDNKLDFIDCDYVFVTYDTPVDDNDDSDTTILTQSINDLGKILKNDSVVIISSQSPVGFCSELRTLLKSHNDTLELAYSPENLRLGEAINCYLEPERIIIGTDNKKTEEKCLNIFREITNRNHWNEDVNTELMCMSLESSEMVKHGINSFLATSIVFADHLSDICHNKGANMKDVVRGMKSDKRIGKKAYLTPGVGFSGGTLGRDLKVLQKINNKILVAGEWKPARIFESVYKYNNSRKIVVLSRLVELFGGLKNKNIGVLGLTYKPGTSTLRRSIPLEIINLMIESGASIKAFDPKADYNELTEEPKFEICGSIKETIDNVDLIVILTEWDEFKIFNWDNVDINIFDTKGFLDIDKNNYYTL